eukprot:GHVS01054614.1.p1 GENE.GHVS01054614.1~~GHVS01054614.1.p1  ORF type:complete len:978 (+),score=108.65 GHVS01054614.1:270-3203(+)
MAASQILPPPCCCYYWTSFVCIVSCLFLFMALISTPLAEGKVDFSLIIAGAEEATSFAEKLAKADDIQSQMLFHQGSICPFPALVAVLRCDALAKQLIEQKWHEKRPSHKILLPSGKGRLDDGLLMKLFYDIITERRGQHGYDETRITTVTIKPMGNMDDLLTLQQEVSIILTDNENRQWFVGQMRVECSVVPIANEMIVMAHLLHNDNRFQFHFQVEMNRVMGMFATLFSEAVRVKANLQAVNIQFIQLFSSPLNVNGKTITAMTATAVFEDNQQVYYPRLSCFGTTDNNSSDNFLLMETGRYRNPLNQPTLTTDTVDDRFRRQVYMKHIDDLDGFLRPLRELFGAFQELIMSLSETHEPTNGDTGAIDESSTIPDPSTFRMFVTRELAGIQAEIISMKEFAARPYNTDVSDILEYNKDLLKMERFTLFTDLNMPSLQLLWEQKLLSTLSLLAGDLKKTVLPAVTDLWKFGVISDQDYSERILIDVLKELIRAVNEKQNKDESLMKKSRESREALSLFELPPIKDLMYHQDWANSRTADVKVCDDLLQRGNGDNAITECVTLLKRIAEGLLSRRIVLPNKGSTKATEPLRMSTSLLTTTAKKIPILGKHHQNLYLCVVLAFRLPISAENVELIVSEYGLIYSSIDMISRMKDVDEEGIVSLLDWGVISYKTDSVKLFDDCPLSRFQYVKCSVLKDLEKVFDEAVIRIGATKSGVALEGLEEKLTEKMHAFTYDTLRDRLSQIVETSAKLAEANLNRLVTDGGKLLMVVESSFRNADKPIAALARNLWLSGQAVATSTKSNDDGDNTTTKDERSVIGFIEALENITQSIGNGENVVKSMAQLKDTLGETYWGLCEELIQAACIRVAVKRSWDEIVGDGTPDGGLSNMASHQKVGNNDDSGLMTKPISRNIIEKEKNSKDATMLLSDRVDEWKRDAKYQLKSALHKKLCEATNEAPADNSETSTALWNRVSKRLGQNP